MALPKNKTFTSLRYPGGCLFSLWKSQWMSGQDSYSSQQASSALLRDISSAEKRVRIVLLGLMVLALVGLVFGVVWQN